MADAKMALPVFLPGAERTWEEVVAMATVNDEGQVLIQFNHVEHARALVKERDSGRLICLAFEYKQKD